MDIFEALSEPKGNQQVVDSIRTFRERQGTSYIVKAAAIAKTAFEVTGETNNHTYLLYSGLLRYPKATPYNLKLAAVVMTSLGRVTRNEKKALDLSWALNKGLAMGKNFFGLGGSVVNEGANLLGLMGAGVGAVGGGGLWAINRGITGEDQKLREMELQRDTYHQLTSEVQAELKRRKMAPTPENTAAVVDYLT